MKSWDVKLEVRVLFSKIIYIRPLPEAFENVKDILRDKFITVRYKNKFLEYLEESVVKFSAQSEHFSASSVKGLKRVNFLKSWQQ